MSRKKYPRFKDYSDVGEKIRKIRGSISQKEFALLFGVNQNTVSRWEKGQVLSDEETLKKIAEFGHVTVDWLLYGEIMIGGVPKYSLRQRPEGYESRPTEFNSDHLIAAIAFGRKYLKRQRLKFSDLQEAHFITYLYEHWQEHQGPPGDLVAKRLAELSERKGEND